MEVPSFELEGGDEAIIMCRPRRAKGPKGKGKVVTQVADGPGRVTDRDGRDGSGAIVNTKRSRRRRGIESPIVTFFGVESHRIGAEKVIKKADHLRNVLLGRGIERNIIHIRATRDHWAGRERRVALPRGEGALKGVREAHAKMGEFLEEELHKEDEAKGGEPTALFATTVCGEKISGTMRGANRAHRVGLEVGDEVTEARREPMGEESISEAPKGDGVICFGDIGEKAVEREA